MGLQIPTQFLVEVMRLSHRNGNLRNVTGIYKKVRKNTTLYSHADVRRSISTKFCTVIEEVRAINSPPKLFLGPIKSLVARGHQKFG